MGFLAFFLNAAKNKDFLEIRNEIISAGINAKHGTLTVVFFSSRILNRLMVSNFLFTLFFFFRKRNIKLHKSMTS